MSVADRIRAHELELMAELHGRSPQSVEKELGEKVDLLLALADSLDQKGDIHGAIDFYERAMAIEREIDKLY